MVATFCEYGVNVNSVTRAEGYTPLMIACINGNKEIVEILVAHGASNAFQSNQGKTALDIAEEYGNNDLPDLITKLILKVQQSSYCIMQTQRRKIKELENEIDILRMRVAELETNMERQGNSEAKCINSKAVEIRDPNHDVSYIEVLFVLKTDASDAMNMKEYLKLFDSFKVAIHACNTDYFS